jgi:phosphate butyryltransferase
MLTSIEAIVAKARGGKAGTIAVAAAHDEDVLGAVTRARKENVARAILVGDAARIKGILAGLGEDAVDYEIVAAESDAACAKAAVALVNEGKADFLMKGLLATADLMRAVIDKESGLRTGRLLSHVMLYEVAAYPKLLALTDGGMNTYPDLAQKADILENAAATLKALGYGRIVAACVCGAETVNPKIQATVDAEALCTMTERWGSYGMTVLGPVGLDLAISRAACRHKKFEAAGGGEADILLVPTYEVGNGIGKAMTYFAGAKSAGIVVGAKVPIVLVSRADDAQTKLASIAFGAVVSAGR